MNHTHNSSRDIKLEQECYVNMSQASSCDYSLSQFRKDESSFHIKAEAEDREDTYHYDNNISCNESKPTIDADEDDEEDMPIASRKLKRKISEDEDDVPLTSRKKGKNEVKKAKKKKHADSDDDEDDYDKPKKKKVKKEKVEFSGLFKHIFPNDMLIISFIIYCYSKRKVRE